MTACLSGTGGKRPGQFAKGCAPGPVRGKGGHNQATIMGERIKRQILEVFDRIDGPALLAEWGRANFPEFMRVVLQIIPRQEIIDVQPEDNGVGLKLLFNKAQQVLDSDDDDGDDDGDCFIDAEPADDLPRLTAGDTAGPPGDLHRSDGSEPVPVSDRVEGGPADPRDPQQGAAPDYQSDVAAGDGGAVCQTDHPQGEEDGR